MDHCMQDAGRTIDAKVKNRKHDERLDKVRRTKKKSKNRSRRKATKKHRRTGKQR